MAPRASWKGYLKLSLVSCPVRMYNGDQRSERISFNLLHKDTKNRIAMKPVDPELGQVERSDLVKGYQYQKNQYVIMDEEDFEKVRIESTETINIEAFVDTDAVDTIYNDSPVLSRARRPDGGGDVRGAPRGHGEDRRRRRSLKGGADPTASGWCRSARAIRACCLRRFAPARRSAARPLISRRSRRTVWTRRCSQLAEKLIEQKAGEFKPMDFVDRYEEGLMEIIKAKVKGEEPVLDGGARTRQGYQPDGCAEEEPFGREAAGEEQAAKDCGREGRRPREKPPSADAQEERLEHGER